MTQQNFETAFERISGLVSDFQKHEKTYLSSAYSEQDVRKDFIDKFWMALGWDVNHEQQKNPYEQEVKVERGVDVKGRKKKADYAFLAPNFRDVSFFVEAKKPARNIENPDDYFQTIRYGWNSSAPLSILMDFEQFHVLDCRYKPDVRDALNRALKKFHYTEYIVVKQLPLRLIDFSDKVDRARHDRMVSLVEQMLDSKRQLQAARTDRDRNFYENKCAALDRQIDHLVYELYELTPEEIAIVEGRDK